MAEWCCDPFDRLLADAGEKGMAVVACREGDRRSFYLQARMLERDVREAIGRGVSLRLVDTETGTRASLGQPVGIALEVRIPIRYCPKCGADLRAMASQHPAEFDALAVRMERWTISDG